MEQQSSEPESVPDSAQVDLTAIAEAHPVNRRTAVLNLNTFDASQLTLLEVLDMSDVAGVPPELLGDLLAGKQNTKRMRMLYAMAWCIARRAEPGLTFREVCTWKLEITGEVNPALAEQSARRAEKVVGAAIVSGLAPSQAQDLTIAQIGVYTDRATRRRRVKRAR